MLALVPHFAAWALTLVDGALSAAGTSASEVGLEALQGAGVLYQGLQLLGGGAIVSGLIIGAIAVFLIDRRPTLAAAYAVAGAVLSFSGFIHSPEIGFAVSPGIALGYLLMAGLVFAFGYLPHDEKFEEQPAEPIEAVPAN